MNPPASPSDVSQSNAAMNPPPPPSMYGNFNAVNNPSVALQWSAGDLDYGYDENDNDQDQDGDGNGDGDGDVGDRDAKRRRIARACDMCRKKKIKCDGKMPKCSHCENYKTECIFTHVEKKRAPPKGAKYIEGLENRLGRMESLLRLSGLLAEDDRGRTDLGTLEKRLAERGKIGNGTDSPASPHSPVMNRANKNGSTPVQDDASREKVRSPEKEQNANGSLASSEEKAPADVAPEEAAKDTDGLADQMCSLITNTAGETRYIGSSSGFSIFSPKGIDWVNAKTGDKSFQKMIAKQGAEEKEGWEHWKPEVFNDLFHRKIFKPLPGREECQALLKDYFENFNCMFPLFHEPTFMHLVDKHYSLEPYDGAGWWASLNVALAIGHRLRVMSNVTGSEEDEVAWAYLKNAMAVMTELTMRSNDLLSVQALLGMALFLQGTPNPQPSFFLVSAAVRLAHSIGLHKRGSGFNLNEVENEQRKRVFWIAYLLDKDICLRSGRPPAQDDDDMNVELPSENPPDHIGSIPLSDENGTSGTMNLFRLMCRFAGIQSRVYKQLYSVKASRQSDGELLNTIGELDAQLEEWKDSIPLDFRPEHEIKAAHTPLILHIVVLHFAYYNCLTTIHRMSVHHGYWTSRLSDYAIQGLNARPLNPRVFMSAALCVNAARTSIALIRYIPQGDYACVWMILYYPVSALVTLFANILQNPQDARARSDLKLMSSVVSFLTMLERDVSEPNSSVRRMLSVCAEFERIARVALDKAEREMRGRGKRKQAEKEREKAIKHAVSGEVHLGLEEGKTLEMLQVETQASYRRPVQTPSLRASVAESQASSQSPRSWAGSPPGPNGAEYNAAAQAAMPPPRTGHQSGHSPNMQQQHSQQAPFNAASYAMPNNGANPMDYSNGHLHPHQQQQPSFPSDFTTSAGPTFGQTTSPMTADFTFNPHANPSPSSGVMPPDPSGAFQQPFVPQDLWQMPMTLEWDWAEGLGMGSFALGGGGGMYGNGGAGMGSGGGGGGGTGAGGSWEYNLWPPPTGPSGEGG